MKNSTTKITLGTVQLGLDYGISNKEGKPSREKAYEILDAAIEGGITSFDTAAGYGDSEQILGEYFEQNRQSLKAPQITTKLVIDKSAGHTKKQIQTMVSDKLQKSLERLRSDNIDNLMLHNINDLYTHKDELVSALVRIKEKGYVKKIGVSVYNVGDINEMLKYDAFECVQLPINIIDLRLTNSNMLKLLKKNSVYIYARSIFLQGLFFMKPENLPEKLEGAKTYIEKLNNIRSELGISMAELAFGYVRDIGEIDSLVVGAETSEQVRENIKLLKGPGIPEEYQKRIKENFSNVSEFYLEPWRWERNEH